MKKKLWIAIVIILLIAIFIIPIPSGLYKDGGTREYQALTYKIVKWNRLTGDNTYKKTKIYFFPDNFKSIDNLWSKEEDEAEHTFYATILEINGKSVLVEPIPGEEELYSADKISFSTENLEKIGANVGDMVGITYVGGIMESYPAQVRAVSWYSLKDSRLYGTIEESQD